MAKNLKLTIKNTQLAEALKLGKLTKPSLAGKKAKTTPKTKESESPEPQIAKTEIDLADSQPPPLEKKIAAPPPAAPPPAVEQKSRVTEPPADKPARDNLSQKESGKEAKSPSPSPAIEPSPTPPKREPIGPSFVRTASSSRPPETRAPFTPGHKRPPSPGGQRPWHPPGHPQGHPQGHIQGHIQGHAPRHTQGHPQGTRPPASPNGYKKPPYSPGGGRPPYGTRPPRPPYASTPRPGNGDFVPRQPSPPLQEPPHKKSTLTEPARTPKKAGVTKEYRDIKPQKKTLGGNSFDSRDKSGLRDRDSEGWRKKRPSFKAQHSREEVIIRPKTLRVRIPITVKDLAAEMKLKASELISKLFMQGVIITLNDYLTDETTIGLLGHEFECEITIDTREEERLRITDKSIKDEITATDASLLKSRPPVVTFMGHVDHGKTSLIDAIRKTNTTSDEAGAITQHIGAFRAHTPVGDLTILDTPGHEAFSAMRSRGADITDIIVLVIAGDEGIREQTIEAMEQAKEANVPLVVAINKSDKPNFDAETIYRQLADRNFLPEVWGGTTITTNCSALTGEGIKELLEMLALQAEILELKANPSERARGSVIESEMHKGLGAVATLLVQNGTLRLNDPIVFAQHWARVKTMQDETGRNLDSALPSTPVKITGLSGLPFAGSDFIVVGSEREARKIAEERSQGHKTLSLLQKKKAAFENLLQEEASKGEKKTLNLILRADVQGSLEALKNSLQKISSKKAELVIISEGIGEVTESDIQLAHASKATILGFHTKIENQSDSLMKQLKVEVRLHDIIYHAVDAIKEAMRKLLDKVPEENNTGEALIKAVFKASQFGSIAGCEVTDGIIKRSSLVRLIRGGEPIWKGSIATLKRVKEDVREVSKGIECGILLNNYNDIKEGDIIQAYEVTYLEQDL